MITLALLAAITVHDGDSIRIGQEWKEVSCAY
jgi:hypothetical protein